MIQNLIFNARFCTSSNWDSKGSFIIPNVKMILVHLKIFNFYLINHVSSFIDFLDMCMVYV